MKKISFFLSFLLFLAIGICHADEPIPTEKIQWNTIQLTLGQIPGNKNIEKFSIEFPNKPTSSVGENSGLHWSIYGGGIIKPEIIYSLALMNEPANEQYDPKVMASSMVKVWEATPGFVGSSTLAIPLKNMLSCIIAADFRTPEGPLVTSIYAAMRIRNRFLFFTTTYNPKEEEAFKAVVRTMNSIKIVTTVAGK